MNTNLKTTLTSLLVFSLLATFTVLAVGAAILLFVTSKRLTFRETTTADSREESES